MFVAPLALAIALDPRAYGAFEYALAWATPAALALGLGMPAAVPYFLLKRQRPEYAHTFRLHIVSIGLVGTLVASLVWWVAGETLAAFGIIAATVITMQGIHASQLKVLEMPGRASLLESGLYIVVLVAISAALAAGVTLTLTWLTAVVGLYLCGLVAVTAHLLDRSAPWRAHLNHLRDIIGFGLPLIVASVFMGFLTTSGRLVAGQFLTLEDIAAYGFFFRLSAVVIVLHQLLNVLFYRRIYTANAPALDRYFATILGAILLATVGAWAMGSAFLSRALPRYIEFAGEHPGVYWALSLQMVFWSAISLAEFILYREKRSKHLASTLLVAVLLFAAACWAMHAAGELTLLRLCEAQVATMAGVFFVEVWLLRRAGVRLVRTPLLVAMMLAFFGASVAWLEMGSSG